MSFDAAVFFSLLFNATFISLIVVDERLSYAVELSRLCLGSYAFYVTFEAVFRMLSLSFVVALTVMRHYFARLCSSEIFRSLLMAFIDLSNYVLRLLPLRFLAYDAAVRSSSTLSMKITMQRSAPITWTPPFFL